MKYALVSLLAQLKMSEIILKCCKPPPPKKKKEEETQIKKNHIFFFFFFYCVVMHFCCWGHYLWRLPKAQIFLFKAVAVWCPAYQGNMSQTGNRSILMKDSKWIRPNKIKGFE